MRASLLPRACVQNLTALLITAVGLGATAFGQEPATNAAAAVAPVGVTSAMEQDFLARYDAALKAAKASQDQSGLKDYFAMFAHDPKIDPQGREAFDNLAIFAIALAASGNKPTFSFVPVEADQTAAEEKPMQFAGKMYEAYLPPVIVLKTTFEKTDQPATGGMSPSGSTVPLCLENGRLMFIGIKEIPGAVLPPVDNPADNFDLIANHRKADSGDVDDDDNYKSLDALLGAIKQAKVEVMDSGQNDFVYFVLCRVRPNYFVYVQESRPGKENYSFQVQVTDSNHAQLKADPKEVTLVEDLPGVDGKPVPLVQGDVYQLPAGYEGQVNVLATYGDLPDKPESRVTLFKTVEWK